MSDCPMTPLRRRLIDEMTLRGYAERSIHSYVQAVRQLSKFHGRSPDRLTDDQARAYLVHLTTVKKAAPGTLSVYLAGIRLFYGAVLGRDIDALRVARPKRAKDLPVVLSRQEVWEVLDLVRNASIAPA